MDNKELTDILYNIPEELFQSKNLGKLHSTIYGEPPRLKLFTSKEFTALELILDTSMQFRMWYKPVFENVANQIKSYLEILGFTEESTIYASARYTPNLGIAINSTMADAEIAKLMQIAVTNQILNAKQDD